MRKNLKTRRYIRLVLKFASPTPHCFRSQIQPLAPHFLFFISNFLFAFDMIADLLEK